MKLDERFIGKTYDDFLFRLQKGIVVSRRDVGLRSNLARSLSIELPVISSNMDSVTEANMARAMALEGGMGIVHRAMSITRQAEMVRRVKRSHSAVIEHPLRLPRGTSIGEAKVFIRRHHITGIVVEESPDSGRLAGLLTKRDIPRGPEHDARPVDDFMTPHEKLHTARPGVKDEEAERILFENRIERLPLVDDERNIRGLITLKDLLFFRNRPFSSKDAKGRLLVGAAVGAAADFLERAEALADEGVDLLVIDIAHGHSDVMAKAIEAVRARYDGPLACGNVATFEGARFLAERAVDAIKVGVGPGRGCRTRLETAAGVPQLQAIREAYCAVEDSVPIIADGGISFDKDIFLALVAGASTVMLGSALSGTDESPGHVIEDPGTHQKRKIYRGMTSPQAVYGAYQDESDSESELLSALETPAEGMEVQVPYKGSVLDVLRRIRGHLQSAVSYAGERSLADARAKIVPDPMRYLIPLSEAAKRESYER